WHALPTGPPLTARMNAMQSLLLRSPLCRSSFSQVDQAPRSNYFFFFAGGLAVAAASCSIRNARRRAVLRSRAAFSLATMDLNASSVMRALRSIRDKVGAPGD